ncbi:MAG: CPBP family intramembrane metalloprotease [Candidatus Diapherotrites archaeon]|nr:CPBP family intramembrane metalloprotease [Candidatus Diapherotrites archaeon]
MRRLIAYAFLLLGVLDTLGLLTGALDVGERVLSSVLLLLLWYGTDLPKHLFGESNRFENIAFLAILYTLSLKNLLYHFGGFLPPAALSMLSYGSLLIGFAALNIFLVYIALKKRFRKKSIVHRAVLSAKKYLPLQFKSDALQFVALNFVCVTFFLFVFDPISQWLIASLDKSLLIIALAYLALNRGGVKKAVDAEESLINTLLRTFKARAPLALSLVVLVFFLSEIGFFLVPLFTGAFDPQLEGAYASLPGLIAQSGAPSIPVYFLSITAFLLFVAVPGYLLASQAINRRVDGRLIARISPLALASFFAYFASGVFHVESLASKAMIGVAIWLSPFPGGWLITFAALAVLAASAIGVWASRRFREAASVATVLVSLVFFGDYFAKFFVSSFQYFSSGLSGAIGIVFANYLLVTIVFFAATAAAFMRYCSKAAAKFAGERVVLFTLCAGYLIAFASYSSTPAAGVLGVLANPVLIAFAALAAVAYAKKALRPLAMFFAASAAMFVVAYAGAFAGLPAAARLLLPGGVMLAFAWKKLGLPRLSSRGLVLSGAAGIAIGLLSFASGESATLVFANSPWPWILFFSAFTAVSEEAFFRGMLFSSLRRGYGFMGAAVLSSALFAAAHLAKFAGLEVLAVLFAAGLAFAWLCERHSIGYAVLAHFASNVVLLSLLYFV